MPFTDLPGRQYTDPVTFHEDPIYKVEGGSGTASPFNHAIDYRIDGAVTSANSFIAGGGYRQSVGGPDPWSGGVACAWTFAQRGQSVDALTTFWDGLCPEFPDGPGDTGTGARSTWGSDKFGSPLHTATAAARLAGWLIRPWLTYHNFVNPWMGDDDLTGEYVDAEMANWPSGDGWNLEWECYHPVFLELELAPDETTSGAMGLRTEPVTYLRDATGWHYEGRDPTTFAENWTTGSPPGGVPLVEYGGGVADWVTSPWQPTQDFSDPYVCQFETPEDETADAIPLTMACESLYPIPNLPSENGSGGRENQWLMARAAWRVPQFRWYREETVIPPRQIWGRPGDEAMGAARVYGGAGTVQTGTVYGGIL